MDKKTQFYVSKVKERTFEPFLLKKRIEHILFYFIRTKIGWRLKCFSNNHKHKARQFTNMDAHVRRYKNASLGLDKNLKNHQQLSQWKWR